MKFGEKLKLFRKGKGISLRNLATTIGITPTYLSDIENCKTKAPTKELMNKLIENLQLVADEAEVLIELAADERNELPADISEAIIYTPAIKKLIRIGIAANIKNETWESMAETLKKRGGDVKCIK